MNSHLYRHIIDDILRDFKSNAFIRNKARLFIDELLPMLKRRKMGISDFAAPQEHVDILVFLIKYGLVTKAIVRKVLNVMCGESERDPAEIIIDNGWIQLSDSEEIGILVDGAIAEKPRAVADWRKGKKKAANVLRGAVMSMCNGRANPEVLNEVLEEKLCAPSPMQMG